MAAPPCAQATLVASSLPQTGIGRDEVPVSLELRNDGQTPWSPGAQATYQWRTWTGGLLPGGELAIDHAVKPGESVRLAGRVQLPDRQDQLSLEWKLVDGTCTVDAGASAHPIRTETLHWRLISVGAVPTLFLSHSQATTSVVIENTGSATWNPNTDHFSYHLVGGDAQTVLFDGARSNFTRPVAPGERVELEAVVEVPPGYGLQHLELQWQMVREGVLWFDWIDGGSVWVLGTFPALLAVLLVLLVGAWFLGRRFSRRGGRYAWLVEELVPAVSVFAALLFLTGFMPDRYGIAVTRGSLWPWVAGAAVLLLPLFFVPPRARPWVGVGLAWLTCLIFQGDLLYLRYFGAILPVESVGAVGAVPKLKDCLVPLFHASDLWMLIAPVALTFFAVLWPRWPAQRRRWWRPAGLIAAALLLAIPGVHEADSSLHQVEFDRAAKVRLRNVGAIATHLDDVARAINEWWAMRHVDPEQARLAEAYFQAHRRAFTDGPSFGVARGDNLILVQVEALQRWAVGAHVNGQPVTPFLDSLKQQSLFFSQIFDETREGRTSDAELAVLNSLFPLEHGAAAYRRGHNDFDALPAQLKAHGYLTLSAHANDRTFWNRSVLHPAYGIDEMDFADVLGPGEKFGWGLSDRVFLERMADRLSQHRSPFFAYLITLSSHYPFDLVHRSDYRLDLHGISNPMIARYLQSVHYVDAQLGAFVDALARNGVLEHSVLAIYGDHDAGILADGSPPEEERRLAGLTSWNVAIERQFDRIPFFVRVPGGKLVGTNDRAGSQVDIAPTLMALLGIPPSGCLAGYDLLAPEAHPVPLNPGLSRFGDRLWNYGTCTDLDGNPAPQASCDAFSAAADQEIEAGRFVVEHNWLHKLDCSPIEHPVATPSTAVEKPLPSTAAATSG